LLGRALHAVAQAHGLDLLARLMAQQFIAIGLT
jgi:hypothetical protein